MIHLTSHGFVLSGWHANWSASQVAHIFGVAFLKTSLPAGRECPRIVYINSLLPSDVSCLCPLSFSPREQNLLTSVHK